LTLPLYLALLGLPVHRRGRQEKVRPGTGREAGLGHAGSGGCRCIYNQRVILHKWKQGVKPRSIEVALGAY